MGPAAYFLTSAPEQKAERVDPDAQRLLQRDHELATVVREAIAALREAFPDASIELRYFVDDEHGTEHIYVYAFPRCSFDVAHEIFERVSDDWWDANMNRAGGRFALGVHPVRG